MYFACYIILPMPHYGGEGQHGARAALGGMGVNCVEGGGEAWGCRIRIQIFFGEIILVNF